MRQKLNETYINSLVEKIINETIHEKAEQIERMLKSDETDEGNAFTAALAKTKKGEKFKVGDKTFTDTSDYNEGELDEMENVCEQCGAKGSVMEGECSECGWGKGSMEEGIYDVEAGVDFEENPSFDYVQEEEDMDVMDFEDENEENTEFCKYQKEKFGENDEIYQEKCSHIKDLARKPISMNERLHGKQKNIDKNKNNKIDAEDFKMLRKDNKSGETDEQWQAALAGAAEAALPYVAPAVTDWVMDKMFGEGKSDKTKNKKSITMTESEMISFIEKIVTEEKLKATAQHKGLSTYEKAHKGSGKENDEYLKSVTKKMKEYLKDGSKGDYDTNPEIFPKGNGELAKMDKKAYIPSDAVKDYIDNFTAAGLENLDYDEIHPNEDWVDDNVEGSSRTGNNPEWANTGKSDVNKKRNKIRKDNLLAKVKRKAYNKSAQPVVQDTQEGDKANKILMKLESTDEKKTQKINEEFDRMKQLLNYSKKTQ
jgi:hypothetical protein